jgi:thiamine biosynthesis lipoprotein
MQLRDPSVHQFDAIGTSWWCQDLSGALLSQDIIDTMQIYTKQFTNRYSRFIDTSLIQKLSRSGVCDSPPDELVSMMQFARQLWIDSDGVFDITVGGVLHGWGYGSRHHQAGINPNFWDQTVVTPDCIIVPQGTVLDFGGFGKGWLIDAYAAIMREAGVREFIINGGGDCYIEAARAYQFGLEDPRDPEKAIGSTRIQKGALAASGPTKRSWHFNGSTYHHLVDPETAMPAISNVTGVFVRASTAFIADSLATVLFIRPSLRDTLAHRYEARAIFANDED